MIPVQRILATCAALALSLGADPAAAACAPDRFALAIDIGHDRHTPGAVSARGVGEYVLNRRLAFELLHRLYRDGFTGAFLIEVRGEAIPLERRPARAAARGADLLLSLHHDSVQERYLEPWVHEGHARRLTDHAEGFSIFVSSEGLAFGGSLAFAEMLGEALKARDFAPTPHHAEPIPGEGRALIDAELGVYDYPELVVLRLSAMPAVLFEAGVIANRGEEARLDDPSHRANLVDALAAAIERFCARSG